MRFEKDIFITASAEKILALYADVAGWPAWDSEVKEASIDGSFTAGAQGLLKPASGPQASITFIDVQPPRSFTVESKLPLCSMRFEHEVLPSAANSVRVIHRVVFSGLLAPLFGRLIGAKIGKALPTTLQGLKDAAERV